MRGTHNSLSLMLSTLQISVMTSPRLGTVGRPTDAILVAARRMKRMMTTTSGHRPSFLQSHRGFRRHTKTLSFITHAHTGAHTLRFRHRRSPAPKQQHYHYTPVQHRTVQHRARGGRRAKAPLFYI